ncbi:uncharacterized protein EI97DRAFT_470811 [Westerdykella ornata]|uniref:F-box domain-containing protein n=1 Tax=Westerdykella ornata TaxID=318751 RepID=A0A6A6J659_WESOR|nr:uncharacterized protein EI97DRAFT_470811 [Westerdykella ornata]KAF2271915.1 hypothetical protein EI97DRAFT_470811 [Westerdykella ornata]
MKSLIKKLKALRPSKSRQPSAAAAPDQAPFPVNDPPSTFSKPLSKLESLPAEIRLAVLLNLDINGLKALVHASPLYHQLYRAYRWSTLRGVFAKTLRDVVPDAIAESASRVIKAKELGAFSENYQRLRTLGSRAITDDDVSEDRVVEMVRFYRCIIHPLIEAYAQWAQEELEMKEPLSLSEQARITRGLYRIQLFFNVMSRENSRSVWVYFGSEYVLHWFFCRYKPWEIEEILCVHAFAMHMYDRILREIHDDVRPSWPKFTDPERKALDNEYMREDYIRGTIQLGLPFLQMILSRRSDYDYVVFTMGVNMCWTQHLDLYLLFWDGGGTVQDERRVKHPTEEDEMQRRRDPLPFQQDDLDATGPPLAWTIFWKGTYSNLYGYYIPTKLRLWGCFMWDGKRLRQLLKGKEDRDALLSLMDDRPEPVRHYAMEYSVGEEGDPRFRFDRDDDDGDHDNLQ